MSEASAPGRAPARTYSLLAGLYVSQFLGLGFFYTGLAAILRDRGASLEQLGVAQLLGLFWALKFLWSPLVDRFGSTRHGHYRSWLLVLQPAMAVGLLGLLVVDPVDDFGSLMLLAGLVVLLSATQDIAADALAVRALDPAARGLGNGIQVAGGYLGNMLGGGGVLIIYDRWGWTAAVVALAAFTLLPAAQVWRHREPARPVAAGRVGLGVLVSVFRVPGVARWALGLLPLFWIGISGAYSLVTPMLVDAGWSLSAIGTVVNVVGGVVAMLGAVGGGLLVRRLGRRRAMLAFGIAQLLAIAGLLPLALGSGGSTAAAVAAIGLSTAYAATSTVVNTINMDLSRPESAGTDFTVLASFSFLASLLAGSVGLAVAGRVGYPAVLVGAAVMVAAGVIATRSWFVDRATTVEGPVKAARQDDMAPV
ncbi:Predicted arabinose efflux permease, MFS family [Micromonospora nigra]|uniref:Predicted arabinose efflux permease, MFS family n=1 Tax=Micromonospora nigra TaxID=145857 RepID=A0A1C6T250_9ACTN|nr:MFS transporter [Micromonospora nigra]SCL35739.1 Predicted arabinose efflux permease, MFS family [Micromonospora nigra]